MLRKITKISKNVFNTSAENIEYIGALTLFGGLIQAAYVIIQKEVSLVILGLSYIPVGGSLIRGFY